MTSFERAVIAATRRIPRGKVATYAGLARAIRRPRSSRAVGNALNKNPYAPKVPCHRVVASDGRLGGYAGGLAKKKKMLTREGVNIEGNKIDLKKFGYVFKK